MCRTPLHQQAADALEAQVAEFLRGGGAIARVDNLNQVVGVVAEDLPVAAPAREPVLSEEFKAAHCGEFEHLVEEWAPDLAAVDLPALVSEVVGCVPASVERRELDVRAELREIRREALLQLVMLERAACRRR